MIIFYDIQIYKFFWCRIVKLQYFADWLSIYIASTSANKFYL